MNASSPVVGIIMGSQSDWKVMKNAADRLEALGVAFESKIISAHRTPERLDKYVRGARDRGLKVIIAGAGMAAATTPPTTAPSPPFSATGGVPTPPSPPSFFSAAGEGDWPLRPGIRF